MRVDEKYSDDQPRDDNGRWTDSGGSDDTGSADHPNVRRALGTAKEKYGYEWHSDFDHTYDGETAHLLTKDDGTNRYSLNIYSGASDKLFKSWTLSKRSSSAVANDDEDIGKGKTAQSMWKKLGSVHGEKNMHVGAVLKFQSGISKMKADSAYRFVGSTEDPDRDGDVIRLSGWNTENFEKNPIVFYGHDYRGQSIKFPVGTATVTKDEQGKRLLFDVTFSEAHDDAKTVKALVDEGVLRTVSVGFLAKKMNLILNPDTQQIVGREFVESDLLELSIVPIPANPNAMRLALEKGIVTNDQVASFGLADIPALLKQVMELSKAFDDHLSEFDVFKQMVKEDMRKHLGPLVEAEASANQSSEQDASYWERMLDLTGGTVGYLRPVVNRHMEQEAFEISQIFMGRNK